MSAMEDISIPLACVSAHFALRFGPFRVTKRPVSQPEKAVLQRVVGQCVM